MNINIVGSREEGKTTLAMWKAHQDHEGVVAFDPRGMIQGVVVCSCDDLEKAIQDRAWKDGPLVYRFDSTDADGQFSEFCSVLFPPQFTLGGFSCVVDEAGTLQSAHMINNDLYRAVKQHPTFPPREAVTLIQTNHRLAEFHGASKALMNELYCFQLIAPRDILALEDHTGTNELNAIVRALPKHHCIRYLYSRQSSGEQWELWDKPEVWGPKTERLTPPSPDKPQASPTAPQGGKGWMLADA